eukprot:scaffold3687_cov240-Pinguiococcus_pyrenoidosus.AAC.9
MARMSCWSAGSAAMATSARRRTSSCLCCCWWISRTTAAGTSFLRPLRSCSSLAGEDFARAGCYQATAARSKQQ